jgi:hypothetical protein
VILTQVNSPILISGSFLSQGYHKEHIGATAYA